MSKRDGGEREGESELERKRRKEIVQKKAEKRRENDTHAVCPKRQNLRENTDTLREEDTLKEVKGKMQ